MKEKLILENWQKYKFSTRNFYQLSESITIEYEYRKIHGPRSSYAFVQFDCRPAEELEFESKASWGKEFSANDIAGFEKAVSVGIVDGLLNSQYLYRGCFLNLLSVKYDYVNTSESSFYNATREAMKELIEKGTWKLVY